MIFFSVFLTVIFLVVTLQFSINILTYKYQVQICTNLIPMKYRNINPIKFYSHPPHSVIILLYILHYKSYKPNIIFIIITLYRIISFKEARRRRQNKNIFIALVILPFLSLLDLLICSCGFE